MPFATFIGHAPLVALLRQAAVRERVPQSLIFAGPEGVGKHTAALALAQAVNCPNRAGGDGCGWCPTCERIAGGRHSDVVIVDRGDEATIKIRMLRERVLDSIGYRPFEAQRRVYIIDPADELTVEAQDALLKTLEEPPPAAIIILISAYPETLRPTIRSRCRVLRFGALSDAEVMRVLTERLHVEAKKARGLAAAAGGSLARATAESDFEDDREAALALIVSAAGGRALRPRLKAAAALAKHGSKRRDREAVGARLAVVSSILRDLGVLQAGGQAPLAHSDIDERLRELAPRFDLTRVSSAFSAAQDALGWLDRNASPKIIVDWLAVRL